MNKLEILDKIIEIEDELESKIMSEIPNKVMDSIKSLYGEDGLRVAKIYYKQNSVNSEEVDCPECEEKAKKLIEVMKIGQTITDSLTDENVSAILQAISNKCHIKVLINELINNISKTVKLQFDEVKITDETIELCLIKELINHRKSLK